MTSDDIIVYTLIAVGAVLAAIVLYWLIWLLFAKFLGYMIVLWYGIYKVKFYQ